MTNLLLYRILTIILLPFALLLGFSAFLFLMMSLSQPKLLLQVFLMGAFVTYVFSCLRFHTRHIDVERPAKSSMRDWIRVNGMVTVVMAILSILTFYTNMRMTPGQVQETYDQMVQLQPTMPSVMNLEMYGKLMRVAAIISLGFGIVAGFHVAMSFKILKKFGYLFQPKES